MESLKKNQSNLNKGKGQQESSQSMEKILQAQAKRNFLRPATDKLKPRPAPRSAKTLPCAWGFAASPG